MRPFIQFLEYNHADVNSPIIKRIFSFFYSFRATLYPCPETSEERREMAVGLMTRIEDLNTVLNQTQDHRHRVLVAAAKNIKVYWCVCVCVCVHACVRAFIITEIKSLLMYSNVSKDTWINSCDGFKVSNTTCFCYMWFYH